MRTCLTLLLVIHCYCGFNQAPSFPSFHAGINTVGSITTPAGFERVPVVPGSFAAYLRSLPLRKDNTVYLYNGRPKPDQSLHYAVIDISTGNKDLQQCADVVMRLRAEYWYARQQYDSIVFYDGARHRYRFSDYITKCEASTRQCFLSFMEKVFMNCGTWSLEQQLRSTSVDKIQVGDVLIKGGSPGHAQIVVDMVVQPSSGRKLFLLAEGYMPAQDMHIVRNTTHPSAGPWFEWLPGKDLSTPTWYFYHNQLRKW